MKNSVHGALALISLFIALAFTIGAGLLWHRTGRRLSEDHRLQNSSDRRLLSLNPSSPDRTSVPRSEPGDVSLNEVSPHSKPHAVVAHRVHSMGSLVLGLEYPFEIDVSFTRPVVGGKVASACGCLSVQTTQLDPTTIRLNGMLRVGGSAGTQSKDIHVTGLYSTGSNPSSAATDAESEQTTITLQYSADLALRPSSTKISVDSNKSSKISISLKDGLLNVSGLSRPPELCGLWVSSSTWNNGLLEAVLNADGNSAESVPHYIRFFVEQSNQEKEVSIPILVSKRSEFGPASTHLTLSPVDRKSLEGCLWLRGVPANSGLADVSLSIWDGQHKLHDLPDLTSCKVTPSGNLIRRFQLPSKLIETQAAADQLRLMIAIGKTSCFVNLEIGK